MKIIFATGNKGKLREAAEILGEGFELVTPAMMGITEDIPETGDTLQENSIQKADYLFERLGCDCFADDTGLEVDALGGAPGVHSARYATNGHDFAANMDKLLAELEKVGAMTLEQRTARFRSVITLIWKGEKHFFEGSFEGYIAFEKAGCGGFGYDPVFIPERSQLAEAGMDTVCPEGCTVAECPDDLKNAVSHRGKALRAMAAWLAENK